ncbi:GNAT family N-acetyltransferase [Marinactinospora thermotolerans]|uniref:Acetyltransferases, including N-acetylases of ribosomal proteins n=1 Tax=Marinactinospora thermotolerans DSM 45154 TaxID=1122192 RepID=A0A1T4S2F0_9ACTN|nr:GNAT family N-acetyltransferase [Marinactinospora thermotolerans]SKA22413.1 Acetyltransferases, including N-acetylases of ribosomal proteins [Marinactinospora thermotolerans DSM 45154]
MSLWRIRTVVEDRPGQLADVVDAMAAHGGNVVGLSIHADAAGVVDEFVVDVRDDHRAMLAEVARRSVTDSVVAVAAHPREVGDDVTRALLLTARLRSTPNLLPEALRELLLADEASWTNPGRPVAEFPEEPETTLVVPVGPLRGVRLRRADRPFTWTESARADALVRSVLPPTGPAPTNGSMVTHRGIELFVHQVGGADADAVQRLHRRCTPETTRRRYFSSLRELAPRMLDVFCDPDRGLTLAARPSRAREPVALAHLMYTLDPGVGEVAFLVEDSWQGNGVGTSLARALTAIAADWGLAEVRAEIAAANLPMQRIMRRLGATLRPPVEGVVQARLPVAGTVVSRRPGRLMTLMTQAGAAGRSTPDVRR